MKVLIADKLSTTAISLLENMGLTVTNKPSLKAEELAEELEDQEVLIVRSTKVLKEAIEAAPNLSLIVRAGAGVNTIDIETASSRGIHVANCPGKNKDAVAELALGMLVAADRRIVDANMGLREGKWEKKKYSKARGLKGRTLGVLGLGAIGKTLIKHAKSLEMEVIAWSRSLSPEVAKDLDIGYCATPLELAERSDAISVHLASNKDTRHMLNADFFGKMKAGAILINTSRGEIHDTAALKKAIEEKGLRVALDVFEGEPTSGSQVFEDVALSQEITATPHIGASTQQASEAIALEAVRVVEAYKKSGKPENVINLRDKTDSGKILIVRHYNQVGVLANVLDKLRQDGINVEDMENTIFRGGEAAICSLILDKEPKSLTLKKIMDNIHVIQLSIK